MRARHFTPILLALAAACSSGDDGPTVLGGAVAISAGSDGSCAIGSSGGLACWGAAPAGTPQDTAMGGVDLHGATPIATPVDLIGVSLSRGQNASSGCVVGSNNQAYCWGYLLESDMGRSIGDGIQPLAGFGGMSSIAIGNFVLCGTRTDRGVRCVGWFTGGGRGTDSLTAPNTFDLTPNTLRPATLAFGTAIGAQFGCAIRTDSLVACWGDRRSGRLGGAVGDTLEDCGPEAADWCQPGPATVAGGAKYRQVAAHGFSACAVRIDGGVDCWGKKVGVDAGPPALQCDPVDACLYVPTPITLPSAALRVALGDSHACVLLGNADVHCWGDNSVGQLGRPGGSSAVPVKVSGGFHFSAISAGSFHTCGIEAGTGVIGCWGLNAGGQLGDGTTEDRDHPVAVIAAE